MADTIIIGVLRERMSWWEHIDSVDSATYYLGEHGIQWRKGHVYATYIHEGREAIADMFLKTNGTHLCFVDSDMVLPEKAIWTLYQHDLPIVGGTYYKRYGKPEVCVFDFEDGTLAKCQEVLDWINQNKAPRVTPPVVWDYPDSLMKCGVIGFGCLLIKRGVIEAIPKPRFGIHGQNYGEDVLFCLKAQEQGYPIYADLNVQCGHLATQVITHAHFRNITKWERAN